MPFKQGESGNPAGRPVGIGRVAELKRMLFSKADEVIEAVLTKAIDGDLVAAKLIIDRLIPTLRPVDLPASIPRADSGSPADQSAMVIDHLLSGAIPPDQAARIMQSLQAHYQMTVIADLERRISALETTSDTENQN